jgi:hypothetical protein
MIIERGKHSTTTIMETLSLFIFICGDGFFSILGLIPGSQTMTNTLLFGESTWTHYKSLCLYHKKDSLFYHWWNRICGGQARTSPFFIQAFHITYRPVLVCNMLAPHNYCTLDSQSQTVTNASFFLLSEKFCTVFTPLW